MRIFRFMIASVAGFWMAGCSTTVITSPDYIYYDKNQLDSIQREINKRTPRYVNALAAVETQAQKDLASVIESVMDKPNAGPSGNKHDYLSISPYFWPNPNTADGMPWEYRDGQFNPMTRSEHTDQIRSVRFLKSLKTLMIAYTYTGNEEYLSRIKHSIDIWLVNPETRMNPNLNYAQGMPGRNEGSAFGIIEWENISSVVTAMQLLKAEKAVSETFVNTADNWLNAYLDWLLTSDLGKHEGTRLNNHGSWYDYQVVGLMIYLDRIDDAKAQLQITQGRIDQQLEADGAQLQELKRTKSVNYSSMNLMALVQVAHLAERIGVDLWGYQGQDGESIEKSIRFFYPYLRQEQAWQWRQIWKTVDIAYEQKTYPMLHVANALAPNFTVPDDIYGKVLPTIDEQYLLLYGP